MSLVGLSLNRYICAKQVSIVERKHIKMSQIKLITMENVAKSECGLDCGGIEFILWLTRIGKSRSTGYRWQKKQMLKTVNVEGKLFITKQQIDRFWDRAGKGEFAKKPRGASAKWGAN